MTNNSASSAYNAQDHISGTAILSEIKQTIFSKAFKGGKINNVFGASELDFTDADISGVAVIEITQVFADTVIIVPDDWQVQVDLSQFFSAIDDQRTPNAKRANTGKVLILKGNSMFANVDIISSSSC